MHEIDLEIGKLHAQKVAVEEKMEQLEGSHKRQIATKNREKDVKLKAIRESADQRKSEIDDRVRTQQTAIHQEKEQVKREKSQELYSLGADTNRIDALDIRLSEIGKELNFIEGNRDRIAEYRKDKRELFDKEEELKAERNRFVQVQEAEQEKHRLRREKLNRELAEHNSAIQGITEELRRLRRDQEAFADFRQTDLFQSTEAGISNFTEDDRSDLSVSELIQALHTNENTIHKCYIELQGLVNHFVGNFQEANLFHFRVKFNDRTEYFDFAEMLQEFLEEEKLKQYQKRFGERFAQIVRRIGTETNELISKEGEISQVIREINNDFRERNFVGAIKTMELRTKENAHRIFRCWSRLRISMKKTNFTLALPICFHPQAIVKMRRR